MSYEAKKKMFVRIVAGVCAFLLFGSILVGIIAN